MKFLCSILIIIIFAGCNKNNNNSSENSSEELIEELLSVDREFSNYSVKNGTADAFAEYAAEDVILIPKEGNPVVGIDNLIKAFQRDNEDLSVLEWEPLAAKVSESGELGYTFGSYKLTTRDSLEMENTSFGTYVTIWERQPDNTWKFVLDAGNTTPERFTSEQFDQHKYN